MMVESKDIPNAGKIALRNISNELDRGSRRLNTQSGGRKDSRIQRTSIQALDGVVGQPARPVAMVNRHAMDGGEAVVVGKVEDHHMKDEPRMRSLDLVLRSKIQRDAILPILELLVELADRVE